MFNNLVLHLTVLFCVLVVDLYVVLLHHRKIVNKAMLKMQDIMK